MATEWRQLNSLHIIAHSNFFASLNAHQKEGAKQAFCGNKYISKNCECMACIEVCTYYIWHACVHSCMYFCMHSYLQRVRAPELLFSLV